MQLKAADDRQSDIEALSALANRAAVDDRTRARIESEIRQIRAGIAGERDAAYEIEFHSKDRPGRVTIHDLRLELDGRVAQIDHLIVTRLMDVWVLESKHFSDGVAINEFGEWTAFFGGRPKGIPSPVEQNVRHIAVLEDVLKSAAVDLPRRLGATIRPRVRGLVLVSNGARITRPRSKAARASIRGLETVIKAEQLSTTLDRDAEQRSVGAIAKLVGSETTEWIGRQLVALHRPVTVDWAGRFGLDREDDQPDGPAGEPAATPDAEALVTTTASCARCARPVSAAVIAYCEANLDRFGGTVLCYQCQRSARRPAGPSAT